VVRCITNVSEAVVHLRRETLRESMFTAVDNDPNRHRTQTLIFDFEISETNNRKKQKNKNIITGYSVLDTNKKGSQLS